MKNLYAKALLISIAFIAVSFVYADDPIVLKDNKTKMAVNLYSTIDEEDKELLFYSNARFGYSVKIPKIFTKVVSLPTNGNGIILESKNRKSRFHVSGGAVTAEGMLKKTYETAYNSIGGKDKASYSDIGENYWELSWWEGEVFHRCKFLINDQAWCDCKISYPASNN